MKFRYEDFLNAIKLSVLITILIWSFTWNSNHDQTLFPSDYSKVRSSGLSENGKVSSRDTLNKNFVPRKSAPMPHYKSEVSTKAATITSGIIPPFNEWKEMEKVKYEQTYILDTPFHNQKISGKRKLNYASSKCGAKIVASNPEAKHKISILNEKPDEYMMNPCRVRTWFIIELCDTVEATQIEIANYELYSSSPREFSVFWSEIYPTTEWHLLGTFEAKDQRTMQSFNLNLRNLGKFIKVIIFNHHGKEHFCLLSVIRVIGYSMVEKFEDLHKHNKSPEHNDNPTRKNFIRNFTLEKKTVMENAAKGTDEEYSNIPSAKKCSVYFDACNHYHSVNSEIIFLNEQKCRFFSTVIKSFSLICEGNFCLKHALDPIVSRYKFDQITEKQKCFPGKFKTKYNLAKEITVPSHTCGIEKEILKEVPAHKVNHFNLKDLDKRLKNNTVKLNSNRSEKNMTRTRPVGVMQKPYKNPKELKCTCDARIPEKEIKVTSSKENLFEDSGEQVSDESVDSAGLIQKESVLYKLTTRIKASEIDLNLINKYLQQLSQSYRQQMQDLQAMFNETVKAINVASEMSIKAERRQQENINELQLKVTSLTRKVEYLMSGQHSMINRVVEIHVFFIILEIIIISTIFTIFLNIYNRKKANFETQPGIKFL